MLNGSVSSHLLDTFFKSVFFNGDDSPLQKCERGYATTSRPDIQKQFAAWCVNNELDCPKVLRQMPKGDDVDSLNRTLKPHGLLYKAHLTHEVLHALRTAEPATGPDQSRVWLHSANVEAGTGYDFIRNSAPVASMTALCTWNSHSAAVESRGPVPAS
jgi:hypothetical protein